MLSQDEFARLFSKHQRLLYAYLVTLLNDAAAAEEVLQETCVVLLKEQSQFQPGTDFAAWATTIAFNQTRKFRRQTKRRTVSLDASLIEQIAVKFATNFVCADVHEDRRRALDDCMTRLVASDRKIVSAVYGRQQSIKQAADDLGRPLNTLYKAISRIRRQLQECVRRKLRAEELA
jgi:RNA polymerase sigma-70 factor (ECF subfamily)